VNLASGTIQTIAGNGIAGYSGDGIATSSSLNFPNQITADHNGNVFIADQNNCLLRWVDPAGQLVTFAGLPAGWNYSGDGGPATAAALSAPSGITQAGNGDFFAVDMLNNVVRKVTAFAGYGRSTAGLSFSSQKVGKVSKPRSITLSAIGPVTFTGIMVPPGFKESDNCTGRKLDAGDTCQINVAFAPAASGSTAGPLTIVSNAFFASQGNTVNLAGMGAVK
jgi:hypothetical protein